MFYKDELFILEMNLEMNGTQIIKSYVHSNCIICLTKYLFIFCCKDKKVISQFCWIIKECF